MDRLQAIQVFVEIADRGSLTAAADALDMSRTMASRYLESAERWLGMRLLHRTTRRVSLTDAGAEALDRCRQMLDLARDVETSAGSRRAEASGTLRITASTSFAQAHLARAAAVFMSAHPQVRIDLLSLDRAVNLVEERVDLAVRIADRLDDALVARRLATCRSVLCAAPSYLAQRKAPVTVESVPSLRCAIHEHMRGTGLRVRRDGRVLLIPVNATFISNETLAVREAALAGAGISMLPTYLVGPDLASGALVRVLPDCEPEPLGIFAAYLSRTHQPRPLRLMLDFLAERFGGAVAPWDQPVAATSARTRSRTRRHDS